jgi:ABC-type amino acid transport system permease subunit
MYVESFPQFTQWFLPGLLLFLAVLASGAVLGLFFGYLVSAFRHGPFEAFYVVAQVVAEAVPDFIKTSPRRVLAMARLAIKEAIRRRVVLVTFAIFALMILFGSWFMGGGTEKPEQLYVNFVLWGTQMLVLLMGLLLSAFSLPDDIKNKTIYTVVTKPVRSTEIILGRMLGFATVGTLLLVLMGLISYFFVWRSLEHSHQIAGETQTIAAFSTVDAETRRSTSTGKRVSQNAIFEAFTTTENGHAHRLEIIADVRDADRPAPQSDDIIATRKRDDGTVEYQRVVCQPVGNHTHPVTVTGEGENATIQLGPSVGYFRARVPIYSQQLTFYDREGNPSEKGSNVGKVSQRRGYVDGGSPTNRSTLSRATFLFSDVREDRFPNLDFVPLDLNLGVYRSYKGDIEKRVIAGLQFESVPDKPDVQNKYISEIIEFETNEFSLQTLPVPKNIVGRCVGPDGSLIEEGEYSLFDKFAGDNGELLVILSCRDVNQYIGVGRSDAYLRGQDQAYWWNFLKGYIGIWCQLMIMIALGVSLSTFLGSPLVMLSAVAVMIVGFNSEFIRKLAEVDEQGNLINETGGGPIESFVRVVTQQNMMVDIDTGVFNTVIEKLDYLLVSMLQMLTYLAPNFSQMNFSDYLVYGYAVDNNQLLIGITITIAFLLGLTLMGYFCLKTREIAK